MAPLSSPDQSRAIGILFVTVFFVILPPIAVALRFWARQIKNTALSANDYLIVAAVVFTIGCDVSMIIGSVKGGYAQHKDRLSAEELIVFQKALFGGTLLWPLANTFVRLSVLDFYSKTFHNRKFRISAWIIMAVTIVYCLSTVITAFLFCRPLAYTWNKMIPGQCGELRRFYLATGIVNVIIDFGIVILPMPVVWELQMRTSRKVVLTFIFGLGFGICIISVLRNVCLRQLDFNDISYDITYNVVLTFTFTLLEPTLGIINACLPMLQPVVTKVSRIELFSCGRGKSSSRGSITWTRSRSGRHEDAKPKNFMRMHHVHGEYSLTDLLDTQQDITGTRTDGNVVVTTSQITINSVGESPAAKEHIQVKKQWDVQRSNEVV